MEFVKKNLIFFIAFGVLFVLLIIGTFLDLQISKAIAALNPGEYYSTNAFAVFFECFGEMPVYFLPSLGFGIIFYYLYKHIGLKKWFKVFGLTMCVLGMLALNFYASHKLFKYYQIHVAIINIDKIIRLLYEGIFGLILALISFIIALLIAKNVGPKTLKSLAICSLIVVFTALLSQVIVQAIKPIFGRARYRLMNTTGDFSEYTYWFNISIGKEVSLEQLAMGVEEDGYKSFPSGHTTAAAVMLALMSIPKLFKTDKLRTNLVTALAFLFVFMVGYSRMLMGAHFLTDVTFATIITLGCYAFSEWLVLKYGDRVEQKYCIPKTENNGKKNQNNKTK